MIRVRGTKCCEGKQSREQGGLATVLKQGGEAVFAKRLTSKQRLERNEDTGLRAVLRPRAA